MLEQTWEEATKLTTFSLMDGTQLDKSYVLQSQWTLHLSRYCSDGCSE
jgi:hypothetical protein